MGVGMEDALEREVGRSGLRRRELELQAEWFGGAYGKVFRDERGRGVEVLDFGEWNRDPGPDFREAVVRIEGVGVLRGGVEIDFRDVDWEAHRHGVNPAFGEVVLHVFFSRSSRPFFTRNWRHGEVAQVFLGTAEVPMRLGDVGRWLVAEGRCARRLGGVSAGEIWSELEGLGRARFDWQGRRIRRACQAFRGQGLFEAVAGALGYGGNRLPMTLLAQRVRLDELRRRPECSEARLYGLSGFLPSDLTGMDAATVGLVRRMWDSWWRQRDRWQRRVLSGWDWRLGRQRPAHHPCRRLAMFRLLAARWDEFEGRVRGGENALAMVRFFRGFTHRYWDWRAVFGRAWVESRGLAGRAWVAELMVNVVYPLRDEWSEVVGLRVMGVSGRVRRAASRILPEAMRGSPQLRRGVIQQGLIHLYDEFCLRDEGLCEGCGYRSGSGG
jgi:hypothetical protein